MSTYLLNLVGKSFCILLVIPLVSYGMKRPLKIGRKMRTTDMSGLGETNTNYLMHKILCNLIDIGSSFLDDSLISCFLAPLAIHILQHICIILPS